MILKKYFWSLKKSAFLYLKRPKSSENFGYNFLKTVVSFPKSHWSFAKTDYGFPKTHMSFLKSHMSFAKIQMGFHKTHYGFHKIHYGFSKTHYGFGKTHYGFGGMRRGIIRTYCLIINSLILFHHYHLPFYGGGIAGQNFPIINSGRQGGQINTNGSAHAYQGQFIDLAAGNVAYR